MSVQEDFSGRGLAADMQRDDPPFVSRRRSALPVIVLGGSLTGAAVCRILHRARISHCWITNDRDAFQHSRFRRAPPNLSADFGPADICNLLQDGKIHDGVLLPCSDDWLVAVAALPKVVHDRFPSSLPTLDVAETFVDKWKFAQAVEQFGIPHPRTTLVTGVDQLREIADDEVESRLLKPVHSLEFCRKHGVKAYLVPDKVAALSKAEGLDFPIMLQEYIPGPAQRHFFIDGFIDAHGRTCALFARQRLRMYPEKLSNSTFMISIPVGVVQPAADALVRFLGFLNHRGIFSAEFKYDQRDNQFKILEVNARPWWYVEFTARCGVDVCSMSYKDALGLEVEPQMTYSVGRRCVNFLLDLPGFLRRSEGFPTAFWPWFKSVAGADDAIFRWSDPVPAIVSGFAQIRRYWQKQ